MTNNLLFSIIRMILHVLMILLAYYYLLL